MILLIFFVYVGVKVKVGFIIKYRFVYLFFYFFIEYLNNLIKICIKNVFIELIEIRFINFNMYLYVCFLEIII